jgi:uncharacterized protein YukE
MSEEIRVDPAIDSGISDMRSAKGAVPTAFANTIDGDNQLDIVEEYNEIKQEMDDLLTKFERTFEQHVQATEEAIDSYRETDAQAANQIGSGS